MKYQNKSSWIYSDIHSELKEIKEKKKSLLQRERVWEKMRKYDNHQVMEIQSEDDKTIR